MEELTQPETREEARKLLEDKVQADVWTNYGDVNPGPHGGMWVRYDSESERFQAYTTFQSAEVGFDADPEDCGDQYVWELRLGWRDLLTDDGGLSEWLEPVVDRLSGHEASVLWMVVDGPDPRYYVADMPREAGHGGRRVEKENYEAVLDMFGIVPDDGVDEDSD